MFPKAHAAAYVIMALRIAYYKVYYPLAYYSAYFSSRATDFEVSVMINGYDSIKHRISQLQDDSSNLLLTKDKSEKVQLSLRMALEMTARGFKFLPLNIMSSTLSEFTIDDAKTGLIPPFGAVDGLGEKLAAKIVEEALISPFLSKEDFKKRTKANKTIMEKIENMGLLNDLGESD